jgi:hypothetical protein
MSLKRTDPQGDAATRRGMRREPCQVVYDALDAHDCQPQGPAYKATARCPAHEDRMPSLSLCEGADGRAVLFCHAGCDTENVIRALDLRWPDLFPHGHRRAPRSRQPQLVTESALDSAKRVLAAAGRTWRPTTEPDMVVVDQCPACEQPEVWLYDDGRRLRGSCWRNGCSSTAILNALGRAVAERGRADAV